MAARRHPLSVVHPAAEIADDVEIGPFAVIGEGVVIGAGSRISAHAVLEGPTRMGRDNLVFPFAVLGGAPQDKRYQGEPARLEIGDRNTFREHVTAHRGTAGGETRIGDGNLFMVGAHVAHDVSVGSHATLANGVQLAGHAIVEDHATFGGLSGAAQHVRVGESAFVAAGAMCEREVPRFVVVQGDRARVRGLNRVGLERRAIDPGALARLERAYRVVFASGLARSEALRGLDEEARACAWVARFVESLRGASRSR